MPRLGEAVLLDAFRANSPIVPDAWALFEGGGSLFCMGYASGFNLDQPRAEAEIPVPGALVLLPSIIPDDPLAIYADDSFAFQLGTSSATADTVGTWDAGTGAIIRTASTIAGRALTTPLFSADGWLYFLDYDKASSTNEAFEVRFVVRLVRSRIDFTDLEQVWAVDVVRPPTFTVTVGCPRLSESYIRFTCDLFHSEVGFERFDLAIPLAGGAPVEVAGLSPDRPVTGYGLERGPFESLFWAGAIGGGYDAEPYLWFSGDDDTSTPEPRWPDPTESAAWVTGWTELRSLGLNNSKTFALAFGMNASEAVASAVLANASSGGTFSKFVVEESIELGFPIAYFQKR